jgi:hypothetical protein
MPTTFWIVIESSARRRFLGMGFPAFRRGEKNSIE